MDSKKLSNSDLSGDIFSEKLFSNPEYKKLNVEFDRIQFNYKDNKWIFFEHIFINKPVDNINELPQEDQDKIKKLIEFTNHFSVITKKETNLILDLYFDKDSKLKNEILLMDENFNFHKISINEYATVFREFNYYGNEKNKNNTYLPKKVQDYSRKDNSAFELSRVSLNNDLTYGFNLDKLFFNEKTKEIYIFELLLCEEEQVVNPHTSHPNRYYRKNKSKFISLFNLGKEMNTNIYLINYAKENTKHENKVRFMKVLDLRPDNEKEPLLTQNKELSFDQLKTGLEKRIIPISKNKFKIGI